jgi:hypothetical protein
MARRILLALSVFAIVPSFAPAQQSYTIQYRNTGKGAKIGYGFDLYMRLNATRSNALGVKGEPRVQISKETMAFTDEVLRQEGNGLTLSRRRFGKVRSTDNAVETTAPFEGKTYLVTYLGKERIVTNEQGAPVPEELKVNLLKKLNLTSQYKARMEDILPKKPVRVGESWQLPAKTWIKRDDMQAEITESAAKLLKVYEQSGARFGVIEYRVEATIKSVVVAGGKRLTMSPNSRITFRGAFDMCIDGTSSERHERMTGLTHTDTTATGPDGIDTRVECDFEITATVKVDRGN